MRLSLIFLFLILTVNNLVAQEYRKYWKDGELTWDDFQAKPTKNSTINLAYVLMYKTDKKEFENIQYYGVFADAYMDKSLSFVHNNIRDYYQLKYNQVIFNLVEIYRRKLQQRIFKIDNNFEISSLLQDVKSQLSRKVQDFQDEGNYGIQREVTDEWLSATYEDLEKSKPFEIPDFRKSNWTYGMFGGIDFGMYNGDFDPLFNNTLAMVLGFEFSYKKIFMGLNMSFTNSKLNGNLMDGSLNIPQGEKATIGLLNTYFGYPIIDSKKIRVMPFAGYGVHFIGEVGDVGDREEIATGTSVFGLNIDFKNKKSVGFTPTLFGLKEEGFTYFRARIFLNNSNFNSNLKGTSLNIGLSFGLEGRSISHK